jgi:putative transcriptional regulator
MATTKKSPRRRKSTEKKQSGRKKNIVRKTGVAPQVSEIPVEPDQTVAESVHETASTLHEFGLISEAKMREFDKLALPVLREFTAGSIRALRRKLHLTQRALAAYINVKPTTVRSWEQGQKSPSGPSQRLLQLLDDKGLAVFR